MILDVIQGVLGGIHRIMGLRVDLDYVAVIVRQSEDEVGIIIASAGNCLHRDMIREMLLLGGNPPTAQNPQYQYGYCPPHLTLHFLHDLLNPQRYNFQAIIRSSPHIL
jgi:hypothetical protein